MSKSKITGYLFGLLLVFLSAPVFSEDALSKADAAVANILFEYDGSEEFAGYDVSDSGFVDIIFANNIPNKLYSGILNKL